MGENCIEAALQKKMKRSSSYTWEKESRERRRNQRCVAQIADTEDRKRVALDCCNQDLWPQQSERDDLNGLEIEPSHTQSKEEEEEEEEGSLCRLCVFLKAMF